MAFGDLADLIKDIKIPKVIEDPDGKRTTSENLGYIGPVVYSQTRSVGGSIVIDAGTYQNKANYFSFGAFQKGKYLLTFSTPTTSFVGDVGAELTTGDAKGSVVDNAYITSSAKTDSFKFTNNVADSKYVLNIYRYVFDSMPASEKTKVDYKFTINLINHFPSEIRVLDLKSSYSQNESISLNQLYINDLDGWGDVKDLTMDILDGTKLVKSTSSTSFTQWNGIATWAQTSLNQSLKDVVPGNYTVRFRANDREFQSPDHVTRQITITAANPITTPPITPPVTRPLVDFKKDPAKYMGSIRDYDGNNLGSSGSWKLLGDVDIQKDGDLESILVNPALGRFASVGSVNGSIDFTKHGLGGDTRVVGIYIDPTLKNQPQNIGGPFDSQRRFQNDLKNDNLKLLAAGDYNNDGFQDLYFKLGDGGAVLRALMFQDGNIQYANYQSKSDLAAFMTSNNVNSSVWSSWI